MAQPTTPPTPSFTTLPHEILLLITTHLPSSIDAISLFLSSRTFSPFWTLTPWSTLPIDVRSLRCRLHRDLLNHATQTLYYCSRCTSPRIPCEKHGVEAVARIAKRAACRRVVNSSRDPPLRERWLRVASDCDRHKYCCMTRG